MRKGDEGRQKEQVTRGQISLRTGGQGRPTPIHIPTPPTKHKHLQRSFYHFLTLAHGRTDRRMDQRMDQWTESL